MSQHQQRMSAKPPYLIGMSYFIRIWAQSINLHLLTFMGSFLSLCSIEPTVPTPLTHKHTQPPLQTHTPIPTNSPFTFSLFVLSPAPDSNVYLLWGAKSGLTVPHSSRRAVATQASKKRLNQMMKYQRLFQLVNSKHHQTTQGVC